MSTSLGSKMKKKKEKQKRTNSIGLWRHKYALPAVLFNKWAKPWHNPHEATGGCRLAVLPSACSFHAQVFFLSDTQVYFSHDI